MVCRLALKGLPHHTFGVYVYHTFGVYVYTMKLHGSFGKHELRGGEELLLVTGYVGHSYVRCERRRNSHPQYRLLSPQHGRSRVVMTSPRALSRAGWLICWLYVQFWPGCNYPGPLSTTFAILVSTTRGCRTLYDL